MNGPMNPMTEPSHLRTPDGRSLDLYVAGPDGGGTLVFFHGSPGSGRLDRPVVEAAAAHGMRTVGWSRPGYGSSTRKEGRNVADVVADTAAVLDHLGGGVRLDHRGRGGGSARRPGRRRGPRLDQR